jgi:hypothetical protein
MNPTANTTAEHRRLDAHRNHRANWKLWGPYLSDRAWGTVREDRGNAPSPWHSVIHDHSRSRAYRWSEDGLGGICDREQRLCFALALWNERDSILKERPFGTSGPEGNHGEDVKEIYHHLDSTPTHSYMRMLYRYPQAKFPYTDLVNTSMARGLSDPEFELLDTGVFDENRYFDVFISYAKNHPRDLLIEIEFTNRGPDEAPLILLPTLWYRRTWNRGDKHERKPVLREVPGPDGTRAVEAPVISRVYRWYAEAAEDLLFTENETNYELLGERENLTPFVKDAFHRYIVHGEAGAVNPKREGTKVAALHRLRVPAGAVS